MPDQRPLGKIRMTRFHATSAGTSDPAEPGRHRRLATPDAQSPAPRIPAPRSPAPIETNPTA